MTREQQRIAIAEACGWTVTHWKVNPFDVIATKDGTEYLLKHLPDYLNDLNAMHEAEKVLTVAQRITYANQIGVVLSGGSVGRAIPNWWFIHEATASHRAEAFLRTIGKWEEAK